MLWKPRVTVAAVAENDGRFLMVEEQIKGEQRFNQPAGHLEDGEGLVDAVVRECLEETAWQFQPEALVGIYRWRHPVSQDTYLRVTFSGQCTQHDPERRLDDDITAAHWLTLNAIRDRKAQLRSPLVLRSLEDYLAGKRYPIELLVDIATGLAT
jgi:ADP-ribose pyrophosphatase YjhB (NUDIX family)